jgi:hypothetical protein
VTLQVVPKAACDSKTMFLKPAMTCTRTLKKIDQWQQGKAGTKILIRLSEQFLELGLFSKNQAET